MRQHMLNSQLNPTSRSPSPDPDQLPTHVEEQIKLRKETISAFHTAVGGGGADEEDGDEDDGFLVPREKTKDELEQEEEEYREFLAREVGEDIGGLVTVDENAFKVNVIEEKGTRGTVFSSAGNAKDDRWGAKKKKKERKEETDQEFLMRCVTLEFW